MHYDTMSKKIADLSVGDRFLWDDGSKVTVTKTPERRGLLIDIGLDGVTYTYDSDETVQWITCEQLTEDEFDARFTLVDFGAQYGQILDRSAQHIMQGYPENRVWTLVDAEGGVALCSGFAMVNFVGWQVTVEPHPGGNGDIVVDMPDEFPNECEVCHQRIKQDEKGTWIDDTEGDVCMDNDGVDGTHRCPEPEYTEADWMADQYNREAEESMLGRPLFPNEY